LGISQKKQAVISHISLKIAERGRIFTTMHIILEIAEKISTQKT
jgi:hypothetical protein